MTYPDLTDAGFSFRVVPPSGSGSYGVMLVGEAPGEHEDKQGVPFYEKAPAGGTLERMLRRAGLTRDGFVLTNVVWTRPPSNYLEGSPWESRAIEAWRPHLERVIEETKPKVIVALGNVALKALTMYGGKGASITNVRGYVLSCNCSDAWVIPTFHPSYIMQGQQSKTGVCIYDITHALDIAKHGFERKDVRYVHDPSLEDMLAFERGYDLTRHTLSYDIETPKSGKLDEEALQEEDDSYTILRVSLCYDATGYAISVPWQPPFIEVVTRMLATAPRARVWNQGFDNPRLAANGAPVKGKCYDMMEAWSYLQRSLPRGLAFVAPFYGWTGEPWKHLNDSEPGYYSAADAHALQLIGDGVERDLRAQGRWEVFERHGCEVYEVLSLMSRNGLPYDTEQAGRFRIELEEKWKERMETLQRVVPDELKNSSPKLGYKRVPKDTTGMRLIRVSDVEKDDDGSTHMREFERWAKIEDFLPTSWQQVLRLIKHYGQKPGKNRKTKRETSDDDTLKKLYVRCNASKKPRDQECAAVLKLTRECRQLSKVTGTYVNGWRPGRDGRVHATPKFSGKMYRISWADPNVSATIADKEEEYIAKGFRRCVRAPKGRMLVEADWKGIEAVIVGWYAQDADYMRLARIGVHDYVAAHMLVNRKKLLTSDIPSLSWSDADLKRAFRDIKVRFPKDRDDAKHVVHGTNYGMGEKLMAEMYEMTRGEARVLRNLYFSLFPKVKVWQGKVLEQAHHDAVLSNAWRYRMWFWDVYRYDTRHDKYVLGEEAKGAIAFLPRDTAAGMLKEVLLRLRPLAEDGTLLTSTHDAILGECDEDKTDALGSLLVEQMERPVPELGNLSIGVECKRGHDWSDVMEVWKPLYAGDTIPVC